MTVQSQREGFPDLMPDSPFGACGGPRQMAYDFFPQPSSHWLLPPGGPGRAEYGWSICILDAWAWG